MPEISRFYGIVIKMYYADHAPPHFHAEYGEHQTIVNLDTLAIIAGKNSRHARPASSWNGPPFIRMNSGTTGCVPGR